MLKALARLRETATSELQATNLSESRPSSIREHHYSIGVSIVRSAAEKAFGLKAGSLTKKVYFNIGKDSLRSSPVQIGKISKVQVSVASKWNAKGEQNSESFSRLLSELKAIK